MEPLTIAAAAALGSTILGSLGGIFAGSKSNATNLKINSQQLAYDREKTAQLLGFQQLMWNKENQYNSPLAQRQRLEDAGINPYFALGQISPGMASSSQAVSGSSPQLHGVQPVDYGSLGRGLNDVAQQFMNFQNQQANIRKVNAEAASEETRNKYTALREIFELTKLKRESSYLFGQDKYLGEQLNQLKEQHEWNNVRSQSEAMQAVHMSNLVDKQVQQVQLQNTLLQLDINMQPYKVGLLSMQIQEASAHISELRSSAAVNNAVKNQTNQIINGLKLDNDSKRKLAPVIEQQLRNNVRQQGQDYWNPFRYVGTLLGGSGQALIHKVF